MRELANPTRVRRLVDEAVERFALDLNGLTVLTEAASGPFVVTALLAARSGGSVIAVTRDSAYGSADDIREYTLRWAGTLGVDDAVDVHVGMGADRAADADLVTNLGFVRPIDPSFVAGMRDGAAISLMCEPWEVRPQDVDLAACRAAGVPVLGTDERDPRVQTFRFVGMLALKLLLELDVEIVAGAIVVVSSDPFATPIVDLLRNAGGAVSLVDVTAGDDLRDESVLQACARADAVVVAEHRDRRTIIGDSTGIPVDALAAAGTAVAHIAGGVDDLEQRLRKHPAERAEPGCMAVTTDVLGPRPVIDLHAAGLRVGQALVEGMHTFADAAKAEAAAIETSPALPVAGA